MYPDAGEESNGTELPCGLFAHNFNDRIRRNHKSLINTKLINYRPKGREKVDVSPGVQQVHKHISKPKTNSMKMKKSPLSASLIKTFP